MSFQGIELTPEMRKLVVNVKKFFDHCKQNSNLFDRPASILTASAVGISESTVKTIMSAFNKSGENGLLKSNNDNRGRPSFSIEQNLESIVRNYIRDKNKQGQQVTIDVILKKLYEKINADIDDEKKIKISQATLWRTLTRWGFEFGKGIRSAHLKESERIIIQRRKYLREKIANRKPDGTTHLPEIYLDESYVNKNHSRDDTWYFGEETPLISKPTGKGERLIIINAISSSGWVPNAKRVFKSTQKTGDYHGQMNWKSFHKWFTEQLLPNIPKNSLIILDNASYHNVLAEDAFPKKNHSSQKFKQWLTHNDIPWQEDMLKAELYELCCRFAPKPEFYLDKIAFEKGHKILRTPPYHPELQPIENCWATVKNHVAANNDFTMAKVALLLEEGFQKVTSHTINSFLKKIKKQEDIFWSEDAKFYDLEYNLKEEEIDFDDEEEQI